MIANTSAVKHMLRVPADRYGRDDLREDGRVGNASSSCAQWEPGTISLSVERIGRRVEHGSSS